jgi:hypothetical protein
MIRKARLLVLVSEMTADCRLHNWCGIMRSVHNVGQR